MNDFSLTRIPADALTALDLRAELAEVRANHGDDHGTIVDGPQFVEAYRLRVDATGLLGDVLAVGCRVGIATGGYADWGDYDGTETGLEDAINDYLGDADAWEARN